MHHFAYRAGRLFCEDVPLAELAEVVGTPTYVYSRATLERHWRAFDEAFAAVPHVTAFSVKACPNLSVLSLFARLGSGFDVVSGGELRRALHAGADPRRIVFSGVGKTPDEMRLGLVAGIRMFNVESLPEAEALGEVAAHLGVRAPMAYRVNPDIDAHTHPYIATGMHQHKFGVSVAEARALYELAADNPGLDPIGVDVHIGSQLTEVNPLVEALASALELVAELRDAGLRISQLDLGGGLGITYSDESPPHPREYAARVQQALAAHGGLPAGLTLVFEPGRVIAGNAAVLLSRVLYVKDAGKRFVIADAAMNDLIRPTLYGAHHALWPEREGGRGPARVVDVVGPICESGDFLARDRALPEVVGGDLLAVMSAGAYGMSMASNYNSRGRAAEVLVDGTDWHIVRDRERYEDLVRGEHLPRLRPTAAPLPTAAPPAAPGAPPSLPFPPTHETRA